MSEQARDASITDLTVEFITPWLTDTEEIDGNRTYAVYNYGLMLRESGVPREKIERAITLAAYLVCSEVFENPVSIGVVNE
jgi:hypothetical protein